MTNDKQLLYVYEQQQLPPWEGGFHVYVFFFQFQFILLTNIYK